MVRSLYVQSLLSLILCCSSHSIDAITHKPWTLFFYILADYGVDDSCEELLNNLILKGSTDSVHVIACVVQQCSDGKTRIRNLSFEQGGMMQLGATIISSADGGNPSLQALASITAQYPSDHMMISFYNSSKAVYLSDTQLHDICLTMTTCLGSGKKIDIVLANQAGMASMNYAYALSDLVLYYCASQSAIITNFDYPMMIDRISKQSVSSFDIANMVLDSSASTRSDKNGYQLAVLYLPEIASLQAITNECATYITQRMSGSNKYWVRQAIVKSVQSSIGYQDGYIDLCSFYKQLAKNVGNIRLSATEKEQLLIYCSMGHLFIQKLIIRLVASSDYASASGISIYTPCNSAIPDTFYNSYYASHNLGWSSFIKMIN